jgi:hypothetical protein
MVFFAGRKLLAAMMLCENRHCPLNVATVDASLHIGQQLNLHVADGHRIAGSWRVRNQMMHNQLNQTIDTRPSDSTRPDVRGLPGFIDEV